MRKITEIIVHCSATPPTMDIGVEEIRKWHTEGNGWSDIGYHDVIKRDGTIEPGRPIETPGAHARNHNQNSIGVCLVGGVDKKGKAVFNFTRHQMASLRVYMHQRKNQFPKAVFKGHNDVSSKDCPCFDVGAYFG